MKQILLVLAMAASSYVLSQESYQQTALADNTAQCKEWAIMDGVADEDMNEYLAQCLQDLDYQEPDVEAYDTIEPPLFNEDSSINE